MAASWLDAELPWPSWGSMGVDLGRMSFVLDRALVDHQKRKISAPRDARDGFGTVAAAGGITLPPRIA